MKTRRQLLGEIKEGLVIGLVEGLVIGLIVGLVVGLVVGLAVGLAVGLVVVLTTQIIAYFSPTLIFSSFDFWGSLILLIIIQIIGWFYIIKLR